MAEEGGWDGWLSPRQWIPGTVLLLAAIAAALFFYFRDDDAGDGPSNINRQELHEHADFALFVRGQEFDFNRPEFLSTEQEERSKNVHIHPPRLNVVHVHREQTTWDEFFLSLGMELTDSALKLRGGETLRNSGNETLKFFVNGVRVDSIMFMNISDLDRVLISFGSETEEAVRATQLPQVTDEACIVSEVCKARIPPGGLEDEPCTGKAACH